MNVISIFSKKAKSLEEFVDILIEKDAKEVVGISKESSKLLGPGTPKHSILEYRYCGELQSDIEGYCLVKFKKDYEKIVLSNSEEDMDKMDGYKRKKFNYSHGSLKSGSTKDFWNIHTIGG